MLGSSSVANINIFFIWTDDSELPGRSMFCIGHNERYLSGTNKWGYNLFLYLTKSLCEQHHHQRFIFNSVFPPFRWHKRWLPHHPEVSRAVKEKVAVVFRSDWVSPCRASFSSLAMPPRNQTRVKGDPEPVMPGLWSYYTLLSYVRWTHGDAIVPFAPCHLLEMLTFSSVYLMGEVRDTTAALCVSACSASGVPKPVCHLMKTLSTLVLYFGLHCIVTSPFCMSMSSWIST